MFKILNCFNISIVNTIVFINAFIIGDIKIFYKYVFVLKRL